MTRSELIKRLAKKLPHFTIVDTQLSVNVVLSAIAGHLAQGGRAEIRGFGAFSSSIRSPRIRRNPRTGSLVYVPRKAAPRFKAGKGLCERVGGG